MKKNFYLFLSVCLLTSVALVARGQEQGPPKVLQIGREEVKPGKGAAHEKIETAWTRAFANAKWPTHWLAMTSVSGGNEVWFLTGFDSLAAAEKDRMSLEKMPALQAADQGFAAQESDMLSNARGITAVYREELSYHGTKPKIGQMRYFYVTTIRVRPGHDSDFVEATKMSRAAHEKAIVPESWAVYEVTLGAPRGTYLIFQPLKSMADVDAFTETHGKAYRDAVGDDGRKRLAELASSGTLSAETNVFALSAKMSYPSPETVSADPDFWTPKPAAKAAAAASPKKSEKTVAKK